MRSLNKLSSNVARLTSLLFMFGLLAALAGAQTRGGRRVDAERFPGADLGAKINAADKSLGAGAGEVVVSSGGTVRTQVVVSPGHTLRFASGTYASEVGGSTYLLKDGASLRCGRGVVLLESTAPKTSRTGIGPLRSSLFTIVQDHAGSTRNGTVSRNLTVEGCTFRGARKDFNSAYQTVSMGNCHNCRVEGNRLENTSTIGVQIGGSSAAGNYALNSVIARNEFVGVASQNAAITNCVGCRVEGNRFLNPGQPKGPGVSVIDVEPNIGDRVDDLLISNNHIDASDAPYGAGVPKTTNGIVANAGNRTTVFRNVRIVDNTVIGARHADRGNRITWAGILVRSAPGVTVERNTVRRISRGIMVDYDSTDFTIRENTLISCGSGGTATLSIEDSSGGRVISNELRAEPGDALKLGERALIIYEKPPSDNNLFQGNRANVRKTGPRSRVIK
jgi:parallel beta-helix repeat protein